MIRFRPSPNVHGRLQQPRQRTAWLLPVAAVLSLTHATANASPEDLYEPPHDVEFSATGDSEPDGARALPRRDRADDASLLAIAPGTPWHLQLSGKLQEKTWAQVYDIDLFDTPAATIQSLVARGKKVHCYFSAGSYEDWRSDKGRYPAAVLGKPMDGWPGERWVDIRSSALRSVLAARMDLAKSKGCTGIDPDNVDGYGHDTGFPLKQSDTVDFVRWLAAQGHARGLTVGLKNGIEILTQVSAAVDWAVNEQCNEYSECSAYRSFVASGKPVFNVEYKGTLSTICAKTKPLKLSTIKSTLALNGPAEPCP